MDFKVKLALVRVGRNLAAIAAMLVANEGLEFLQGTSFEVLGVPVLVFGAPLLNALAKFGRAHLEEGAKKNVCKVL